MSLKIVADPKFNVAKSDEKIVVDIKEGQHIRLEDIVEAIGRDFPNFVVLRQGANLTVRVDDGTEVEFTDFYTECEDGACSVNLGALGPVDTTILAETPLGAATADGSQLVYVSGDRDALMMMALGDEELTESVSNIAFRNQVESDGIGLGTARGGPGVVGLAAASGGSSRAAIEKNISGGTAFESHLEAYSELQSNETTASTQLVEFNSASTAAAEESAEYASASATGASASSDYASALTVTSTESAEYVSASTVAATESSEYASASTIAVTELSELASAQVVAANESSDYASASAVEVTESSELASAKVVAANESSDYASASAVEATESSENASASTVAANESSEYASASAVEATELSEYASAKAVAANE